MKEGLAVITVDKWEVVGAIASTVNAIASLVAISFVAIQLKSSNRIAQAQLINELERDIEVIDRTFAGRFFILFNNPKVQEIMNTTEISPFMDSIRDLYHKWYVYRKEKGLPLTGFRDIIP
jgi:hypothetical protein